LYFRGCRIHYWECEEVVTRFKSFGLSLKRGTGNRGIGEWEWEWEWEWGMGNGEWGMGNGERGIFKMGNL